MYIYLDGLDSNEENVLCVYKWYAVQEQ